MHCTKCHRLILWGQVCVCGINSLTGEKVPTPTERANDHCQRGHQGDHYISEDGDWWMGKTVHNKGEACSRRW